MQSALRLVPYQRTRGRSGLSPTRPQKPTLVPRVRIYVNSTHRRPPPPLQFPTYNSPSSSPKSLHLHKIVNNPASYLPAANTTATSEASTPPSTPSTSPRRHLNDSQHLPRPAFAASTTLSGFANFIELLSQSDCLSVFTQKKKKL